MKKLKENVHAIQVGCEICEGPHLIRDCPLKENDGKTKEVKYGEGRPFQGNGYRTGPSGYNRPPYERRSNLEQSIQKYFNESAKKQMEREGWLKSFQEGTALNLRSHDETIKSLETKIGLLTNQVSKQADNAKGECSKNSGACKATFSNNGQPLYTPFRYSNEELEFFAKQDEEESDNEEDFEEEMDLFSLDAGEREEVKLNATCSAIIQHQLPPKEKDPESFILPCSIDSLFISNALADLGASISIMPFSMYKRLSLGPIRPVCMTIEMADRTVSIPKGIVDSVLVKIDEFTFSVNFVILNMEEDSKLPIILGRPLLAIAHAMIDVFNKLISLTFNDKKIVFNMDERGKCHKIETVYVINNGNTQINKEEDFSPDLTTHELLTPYLDDSPSDFSQERYKEEINHSPSNELRHKEGTIPKSNARGSSRRRIIPMKGTEAASVMGMLAQHDGNNGEVIKKYHWCEAIPVDNEIWYDLWASCNPNADLYDGGDDTDRVGNNKHLWSSANDNKRRLLEWNGTMAFDDWVRIVYKLNATVDLSKVTMRKHKKPKVVNPSSNQPILASSGPIITEWSVDDGDIELSTIVEKNNQVKPVSLDPLVNDPNGPHGASNKYHSSDKLDMNAHGAVGIDKVGVDALKQPPTSYASATSNEPKQHTSNFRRLECNMKANGVDLSIPMKVVEEVNTRFENTLYGYFLGQRLAFPVVDYYVRNAWGKFGIHKVMMNAKGFFFFKFNSKKGVDDVLENGPWLIRNVPIILKPWTLNTNLLKEDLTNIPVWVKFHDVPLAMFSDNGLSLLATLIGTPKRLDTYTSQMCKKLWGRSSFARCMIEVKSDEPTMTVNDGFKTVNNKKKGKQGGSTIPGQGGVPKPAMGKQFQYRAKKTPPEPKKVDGNKKNASDVASSSGTKIPTSNQFDALNMKDTDAFGIPSNDTNKDVASGHTMEVNEDESTKTGNASQEPLVSDLKEKESVVDPKTSDSCTLPASSTKRVNPFSKVGEIVVSDSEDEVVANPFDKSANLFGGGQEFENDYDDYDYDDYANQVYDLPGNLDAFNAMYGTKLQDECNGGSSIARVNDDEYLWTSTNDNQRNELEWVDNLVFDDWIKIKYGKIDAATKEKIWKGCVSRSNPCECKTNDEGKEYNKTIWEDEQNQRKREVVEEKLNQNGTEYDEDDIDGIMDYLELQRADGFTDPNDETYEQRRCKLLCINVMISIYNREYSNPSPWNYV
ncbi:zinc knuckle CX2CX4HX4C [Artemisia annua]|uniref:Zinc knuckle CX2CX4HX4C n=1 Tax=Artemisia annua TaxID=35608 RepID=A0A2U1PB29_ARTAN|nr:zinc knuckle CX2CX4HX4C [Artemisia annua]